MFGNVIGQANVTEHTHHFVIKTHGPRVRVHRLGLIHDKSAQPPHAGEICAQSPHWPHSNNDDIVVHRLLRFLFLSIATSGR
ncbi:hypothetical protein D3C73_966900 [compost metagenome]